MTTSDLHTLTGAYAVGAVSGPEAERFRRHLLECPACAQEVRELRETAARLAVAAAVRPPAGLRTRVMAALPEVRQLPPEPAGPAVPTPLRPRWRRLPQLAAAACLVLAVAAAAVAVDARHDSDRQRVRAAHADQRAASLAALITAPDRTSTTRRLRGGGTATAVASARLGRTAVLYAALPPLPGTRVYEMWYIRGDSTVPAALVPPGRSTGTVLLRPPGGAAAIGITSEPPGGSPAPTTTPLALL